MTLTWFFRRRLMLIAASVAVAAAFTGGATDDRSTIDPPSRTPSVNPIEVHPVHDGPGRTTDLDSAFTAPAVRAIDTQVHA